MQAFPSLPRQFRKSNGLIDFWNPRNTKEMLSFGDHHHAVTPFYSITASQRQVSRSSVTAPSEHYSVTAPSVQLQRHSVRASQRHSVTASQRQALYRRHVTHLSPVSLRYMYYITLQAGTWREAQALSGNDFTIRNWKWL